MRATYDCRRARRDLHRPRQRAEQPRTIARRSRPPILAASSRCRRMAPACSARSISPRWSRIRSRRRRGSTWRRWSGWCRSPCACSTMSSTSRAFRCRSRSEEAKAKRRIGLGVTGLADALIFCGVRYGSPEAVQLTRDWLARGAARCLSRLGRHRRARRAAFPLFRPRRLSRRRDHARRCPRTCARRSRRYGIRNALLTSIAPTGTISLFADNVSSGIEPVFAFAYRAQGAAARRHARARRASRTMPTRLWRTLNGATRPLPAESSSTAADAHAGRAPRDAGGGAAAMSTARSPRPSTARATSPSRRSRPSTRRPMRRAARAARPTGPTTSPARCCEVEAPAERSGEPCRPSAGPASRESGVVYMAPAARPARGSAGLHLQDQMAGQRSRHLHHHQRHRCRTAAAGRSRSSSIPRTWSTTPGRWR